MCCIILLRSWNRAHFIKCAYCFSCVAIYFNNVELKYCSGISLIVVISLFLTLLWKSHSLKGIRVYYFMFCCADHFEPANKTRTAFSWLCLMMWCYCFLVMIHSALVAYLSLEIGLLFLGEEGGKGILFGLVFSLFCRVGIFFICLFCVWFCLVFLVWVFFAFGISFPIKWFFIPTCSQLDRYISSWEKKREYNLRSAMDRNIRRVEKRLSQLPRMRVFPTICKTRDERGTNRTQ